MSTSIRSPWPGASCVPVQGTFLEEPALSGVMITSGFFHFSHVQRKTPYSGSVTVSLVSVSLAKSDPMSPFITIHWIDEAYPLDRGAICWVSSFFARGWGAVTSLADHEVVDGGASVTVPDSGFCRISIIMRRVSALPGRAPEGIRHLVVFSVVVDLSLVVARGPGYPYIPRSCHPIDVEQLGGAGVSSPDFCNRPLGNIDCCPS